MVSLNCILLAALLPLSTCVDLGALLWTSSESTDVFCRYVFFSYVACFLLAIVAAHVYASMVRPEKKQFTYALAATQSFPNPTETELTPLDGPETM